MDIKYHLKRGFSEVFNLEAKLLRQAALWSVVAFTPAYYSADVIVHDPLSAVRTADIGERQVKTLDESLDAMRSDYNVTQKSYTEWNDLYQERVARPDDKDLVAKEQKALNRYNEWDSHLRFQYGAFENEVFKAKEISEVDAEKLSAKYRQMNDNGFGYRMGKTNYSYDMSRLDECQNKKLDGTDKGVEETRSCMWDAHSDENHYGRITSALSGIGLTIAFFVASGFGSLMREQTENEAQRRAEARRNRRREKADAKEGKKEPPQTIDLQIKINRKS